MTSDNELEALRAEVARLRAKAGILHPDVEPAFSVGDWVEYDGVRQRVTGRSIDQDGNAAYNLGGRVDDGWEHHAFDVPEESLSKVEPKFNVGQVVIADGGSHIIVDRFHDEETGDPYYHVQESDLQGGHVGVMAKHFEEHELTPATVVPQE